MTRRITKDDSTIDPSVSIAQSEQDKPKKSKRAVHAAVFRSEDGQTIYEATLVRTIIRDGKTYTRVKREAPKSRATRLGEEVEKWEGIIGCLDEVITKLESLDGRPEQDGVSTPDIVKGLFERANSSLGDLGYDEAESLQSEMEEWRDNLPENLQSSSKYDMLDEAANTLGDIVSGIQDVDTEIEWDPDTQTVQELIDLLTSTKDAIQEAVDNAAGVEFPGMFS